MVAQHRKPRVFVGSSREGLHVAEYLQLRLDDDVAATVWHEATADPEQSPLESLERRKHDYDFAILVLAPDDARAGQAERAHVLRDSLLLEIGLFVGALGPERTCVVKPLESLDLPTDLAGSTVLTYASPADGDWAAVLGAVSVEIKGRIRGMIEAPRERVTRQPRRRSLGMASLGGVGRVYPIGDVSTTGAFLETDQPVEPGERLDVTLHLDSGATARVSAEVVRIQHPGWGRTAGVGVAFVDFEGTAMDVLEDWAGSDRKRK